MSEDFFVLTSYTTKLKGCIFPRSLAQSIDSTDILGRLISLITVASSLVWNQGRKLVACAKYIRRGIQLFSVYFGAEIL